MRTSDATLSLEKALRIVESMAAHGQPQRLADIAQVAGLPNTTALRLLNTLRQNRYVNQDPITKRYYLSLKLFSLGNQISAGISIGSIARPFLHELSGELDCSVNLAVEQDQQMIILDVVGGAKESNEVTTQVGRGVPLHCTALGKAMLSGYGAAQLEAYIQTVGLSRWTDLTIIEHERLLIELAEIRKQGVAIDRGEYRSGIIGIGAPILDSFGAVMASISVADLASVITSEEMNRKITAVKNTAAKVSRLI